RPVCPFSPYTTLFRSISHGGDLYTYYGHLDAYRVGLDASVSAGQLIGDMGATGNVTGPHLHFETHSGGLGTTTNPVPFMTARGVDRKSTRLNSSHASI